MDLYFTTQEKRQFLKKRGYEFRKKKFTMAYPEYHNDMSYEDVVVEAIYKKGKMHWKPGGYSFTSEEWLDTVFEQELKKALLEV